MSLVGKSQTVQKNVELSTLYSVSLFPRNYIMF